MKWPVRPKQKRLAIFLLLFIAIQLLPSPPRNHTEARQSFSMLSPRFMTDTVAALLQSACNDCHSNNSRYPWYTAVQPVAWYTARHITKGKEALNFDELLRYSTKKQISKLESIAEQLNDGRMPLKSYTLIHRDARLSGEQTALIMRWADSLRTILDTLE
ncbi:heme-binding domain-containing protein [Paraflavitalea sp. CAU 1676]|uniref:heme-binding domain-containing protein n=1 Tax=Paraflavitalea sp. CAU 1676 TaxID=3032598 RepID=UPI0023DA2C58|nr:heme-binding domain-containing protein [Paraflavitalea sp. CAU 1676]MDF2191657.1 heme-binding domain-containing protein [Paraflavitalea sp. CAU 1676]